MKFIILYTIMQMSYQNDCQCTKITTHQYLLNDINDVKDIKGNPIKLELIPSIN